MTFGRTALSPVLEDYILLRIQENAVGILLAFVITFLTVPIRATALLKINIVNVLDKLSTAGSKVLVAFTDALEKEHNGNDTNESEKSLELSTTMAVLDNNNNTLSQSFNVSMYELASQAEAQYTIDHEEMTLIENNKKIQSLTYIAAETLVIAGRLTQQPLLLEQAIMELIFMS